MTVLSDISTVALGAGNMLRGIKTVSVDTKGEADFVTQVDMSVQDYIIDHLHRLYPDAQFLAEEKGISGNINSDELFIIDPIDGTTNFINQIPFCAICVAYCKDGLVRDSVVYNPFMSEMFTASLGKGAFLNRKRIRSDITESMLKQSVMIIEDRFGHEPVQKFHINGNLAGYRALGSAALSICYVACNRASAYVSCPLHIWDYAASSLILEEAGGKLLELNSLLDNKVKKRVELKLTNSVLACTTSFADRADKLLVS